MRLSADERVLVDGCRRGDEQAWRALFRAYAPDLGLFLKGMLRDASEVDDLVQRVLLEFLASLDRYRGDAGLRTWLHRIARHVALRDVRGRKRQTEHVRAYAETVSQHSETTPERQAVARDRLEVIQGLLSELNESFREVWILRELQGFDVEETAAVLEIPPATVRTRHHRARQKLLESLHALDAGDAKGLGTRASHVTLISPKGGDA